MLRFIKHNLTSIDSIEFYPILSLLIFVIFFILVITYVIRMKKTHITELSASPFEEGEDYEGAELKNK
jgi:cbb3-type cytochrome oxidase subunit 3